nr:serine/threonine-protein phosphatase 1 regulatory subunit 10-like [Penaeus vannamei]
MKGHGGGSSHKGHGGYGGSHHDQGGYKGHQGYHADKGHKGSHYGDHGKAHYSGYHGDHGKLYKGHDDKHKYYGDAHSGKKGGKGHHYGSKGHHNKGHKDKDGAFPRDFYFAGTAVAPNGCPSCHRTVAGLEPARLRSSQSPSVALRSPVYFIKIPVVKSNSGATFRASVDLYMPERDRQLGFKNVYHKEEYGHTKKFYDDSDNKKYHNNYDDLDTYFKAHKGSDYKGGHYKNEWRLQSLSNYFRVE